MTTLAYFDCPTGLSGDMCLGALVHAGVPLDYLSAQLRRLGIEQEYKLWSELVHRNGQHATKIHVDLTPMPLDGAAPAPSPRLHGDSQPPDRADSSDHPHHSAYATRHLPDIERLIRAADLPDRAAAWSLAVFQRLAEAEGAVHGIAPDQVHFHEVGATDAIVDIVGTCLGLDWLGIDQLYCSALPTGGGTVWAAHGRLPVPTPAVLKLWEMRQVPIYSNGIQRELVTPTGAAIITTLAHAFGCPPTMTLERTGLGAGSQELPSANILRLWVGRAGNEWGGATGVQHRQEEPSHASVDRPYVQETVAVLETQIDDVNPQAIGYVFDALLAIGAVDVFTQGIGMKKSRPGILLTVICPPDRVAACERVLFRETTTLGIRHRVQGRSTLQREICSVLTRYGTVRIKIARQPGTGTVLNVQPEYEDCAQIAKQLGLPWREVHQVALQAAHDNFKTEVAV